MMKNKKKNDKFIIFLVFFLLFAFLSWIFGAHIYQSGELIPAGMRRAGLYDLLVYMISGFTYKFETVLYILSVGGIYGILVNTESYKKVVHKVTDFIKGKEKVLQTLFMVGFVTYTNIMKHFPDKVNQYEYLLCFSKWKNFLLHQMEN